jgi:opacity protein-like surface antigen
MGIDPMRKIAAASIAVALLATTTPSFAADLFGSAPPPLDAPQTELGSNWYIRGDVGLNFESSPTIVPENNLLPPISDVDITTGAHFNGAPIGDASTNVPIMRGNNKSDQNVNFDLGFGYRVNDYFRLEAMYDYHQGPGLAATGKAYCPGQVNAVSNSVATTTAGVTTYAAIPVGYAYDFSTCNGYLNATQYNNLALANAYVDLGTYWILSPYIGAGFGLNVNTISGNLHYTNTSDGTTYTGPTVTGSAPGLWVVDSGQTAGNDTAVYTPLVGRRTLQGPKMEIGPQNWTRNFNSTKYTFAAALMAGVGIKISQSATLDLGYRYINPTIGGSTKSAIHSFNVGVRYNLN